MADREACLSIFDANCPRFFAPNEREDYVSFLSVERSDYEVCVVDEQIVGAFGLIIESGPKTCLRWILIDPRSQGIGVGSAMMDRIVQSCRDSDFRLLNIGASHKSAPFFAKFGAETILITDDGWGPGMHRVDMELRP